ncbi:DNA repair exonuclease [Clostridium fermenticellae]|uniref:DNA repair exonuclease n=1 Tax=Clostridium fermenticellae TaxID=2068654 RepID=A0A386H396_9CLOT|nr:DNA repair exonuclease [Clostridium fermenticellae]AYD40179.1 DNA repair exonuclease [Clostridium fermenticellae]
MKTIKIVHCADIHLGSELSILGNKAAVRKAEIKGTFFNILKLCRDENVELLLIAGDLFDDVHVNKNLLCEIRDGFDAIKDTTVVIAPGNHDPASSDSPYVIKNFWPKNVIIFKNSLEKVEIKDSSVCVWGTAFLSTQSKSSMIKNFKNVDDGLINICVVHGELVAQNQRSRYNPITEKQISDSKMDYIALGHIHKKTDVLKAGSTFYAYSGCPEGRGFDELDEKGIYIGTISKDICKLDYRRVCGRMNIELRVDISNAQNARTAADIIIDKMKLRFGEKYAENLYKIDLYGMLSNNVNIDINDIRLFLCDVFFIKLKDSTRMNIDFDNLSDEITLKNVFVRKMLERIDNAEPKEKEKLYMALKIGLRAFSCEVKYNED